MVTEREKIEAMRDLLAGIIDAVRLAGPLGAPGGPMYAALMSSGCTLEQFNTLMGALVSAGRLRRSGDLYFVV